MAVVHKGVDKIIDSSNKTLEVGVASDAVAAVNDGTTGLSSKAQASDVTAGLALKLDATATAVNSSKLGNNAPSHYATATDLTNGLNGKLDKTAQAADSAKLAGQASSYYVATTGLSATTDGTNALGWDGTKFKTVPVGSDSVTSATKWTTARTISLGGDATGSVSIDGTANKTLTVAVANDSHTHDGRYYTESEINNKLTTLETDIKNDILGGAGAAYDTLKELQTELQNNDSEIAALVTTVGGKLGKTEKAADSNKLDGLDSTQFLRSDTSDVVTAGSLTIGTGGASGSRLIIKASDDNVSDHIQFYNGTTRVGEIGVEDGWLRLNQETANNIFTPHMIRADGGFQVDSKWVVSADGNTLYENSVALSSKYLGKTAKAADSDKLDGLNSTDFLRSTAKAVDSDKLDGLDSSVFARKTGLSATTDGSTALGWTGSQFKVVPAGGGGISQLTRDDSDANYTDYIFA